MSISFSFSSSLTNAVSVTSSSVTTINVTSGSANGQDWAVTTGWAIKHESFSNNGGSVVQTTQQMVGQTSVTHTGIHGAHGQPLHLGGGHSTTIRNGIVGRIEDVTNGPHSTRCAGCEGAARN
ncbi:hypothetical protein F5144DRAFT_250073 [Chaetomium tenue]|uniref:Uncharacterized protein n=1 Tax=Chaetomium tenue TaxID=1854479 RepID=A0ACB7PC31_9PEZI|nr:hypothetical protein F5144DRAFT_250073 [Chaetomium globosum]